MVLYLYIYRYKTIKPKGQGAKVTKQLGLFDKVTERRTPKQLALGDPVAICEHCGETLCVKDGCVDTVVAQNRRRGAGVEPPQLDRIWWGFRR